MFEAPLNYNRNPIYTKISNSIFLKIYIFTITNYANTGHNKTAVINLNSESHILDCFFFTDIKPLKLCSPLNIKTQFSWNVLQFPYSENYSFSSCELFIRDNHDWKYQFGGAVRLEIVLITRYSISWVNLQFGTTFHRMVIITKPQIDWLMPWLVLYWVLNVFSLFV